MVEQVRKNVEVELQPILDPDDVNVTRVNVVEVRQSRPRASILNNPVFKASLRNLVLIVTWYFFSTVLSLWNRRLLGQNQGVLGKGPFPAPMLMSSLQFASQIIMANTVLLLGVVKRRAPEGATWSNYFSQVVPNGVCTGLDIGLSNFSLSLITLSFYTMCKSTTPIFLLVFAFLWGIERPSWSLAGVVAVISLGLTLLVAGETQFNMVGFVLVMLASMLSGLRWTITQVLLQGSDHQGASGGPVEVLASLMPVMSLTVGFVSLFAERLWNALPESPYFNSGTALLTTAGLILMGGLLAFLMVWTEFTVIAYTSALTFMVAGTFKEIVTVMAAVIFLGEDFSFINGIGLVVLVAGVALFNYTKYQRLISGEAHIVTPAVIRRDSDAFLGSRGLGKDGKEGSGDEEDPEVQITTFASALTQQQMRGGRGSKL
eukprot:jgi/Botrbrau1/4218/Bobra.0044s0018.2